MHSFTAVNWDGKTIRGTFRTSCTLYDRMANAAHNAIARAGYTTYQLVTIDDDPVPYTFQYR